MTRTTDTNPTGADRAHVARDQGADVFVSIHFNSSDGAARGVETWVRRPADNSNTPEDRSLAGRVVSGIFNAIKGFDANTRNRGVKPGIPPSAWELQKAELSVLSDTNYAQPDDEYHPIRGTLAEVEFIDVPAVDTLLNTGASAEQVKAAVVDGIRDKIIEDIIQQPSQ